MGADQIVRVERWTREILMLAKEAKVLVHERKVGHVAIVVSLHKKKQTHLVHMPLAHITWPLLAQDLLKLGPSCADSPR